MHNDKAAEEWLNIASHDLDGAQTLFRAEHPTDTVMFLLQQSIEKTLKAVLAGNNDSIPKTHDLIRLLHCAGLIDETTEHEQQLCELATWHYQEGRYPAAIYDLPSKEKTGQVLEFAQRLFHLVSSHR